MNCFLLRGRPFECSTTCCVQRVRRSRRRSCAWGRRLEAMPGAWRRDGAAWRVMPRPQQSDSAVVCLWVLTPVAATLALVVVCVAVTTNQWLHTEEKMTNPGYNGTGERDYLSKHTVSGLWTLCFTNREYAKSWRILKNIPYKTDLLSLILLRLKTVKILLVTALQNVIPSQFFSLFWMSNSLDDV